MVTTSVVIPCYNDAEYVGDAIESILRQTFSPIEIVVVDDGSEDRTQQTIQKYTNRDNVRTVTHNKNRGLPAARNTGIAESEGKYIAFLDADDRWTAEKLEHQVPILDSLPSVGLVYSDFYRVTADGEKIGVRRSDDPAENDFLTDAFISGTNILPSTTVMRRCVFDKVGDFDESLRLAQELEMWMRIGAQFKLWRVPEPLVCRRERPESLGSDKLEKIEYRKKNITPKITDQYPYLKQYMSQRSSFLSYLEASAYAQQGCTSEARQAAIEAIRQNPKLWQAYIRLGTTVLGPNMTAKISTRLQNVRLELRDIRSKILP